MNKLFIQDFRCFHSMQAVPLNDLTLLVGENSTGKSTLLAAARIAWDLATGRTTPDFNEEPFPLGAYDQIANFRGGRAGRAKKFFIGLECFLAKRTRLTLEKEFGATVKEFGATVKILSGFEEIDGVPKVTDWFLTCPPIDFHVSFRRLSGDHVLGFRTPHSKKRLRMRMKTPEGLGIWDFIRDPGLAIFILHKSAEKQYPSKVNMMEATSMSSFVRLFRDGLPRRPFAFAPIRTKPERTYNFITEQHVTEGAHVPKIGRAHV